MTPEGNIGTRQMITFFSRTFSDLTVCNIRFWIWKYSKLIFIWSPLWSILVCKIPQFLVKSYRFRQFIILFSKVDTLRLLKIYIMFCPPTGAKCPFFKAPPYGLDGIILLLIWQVHGLDKFNIPAAFTLAAMTLRNCATLNRLIKSNRFVKYFNQTAWPR